MRPITVPNTIGGPCPLASVASSRVEESQMGVVPLASFSVSGNSNTLFRFNAIHGTHNTGITAIE
jgi:hypothetical protein